MKKVLPLLLVFGLGCMRSGPTAPELGSGFSDDFERTSLGEQYLKYGGSWHVNEGVLKSQGDQNIPLWLNVALPADVRIEMDVWSESKNVDMKVEVFGDGIKHESGYIVIFGGWKNSITAIARLDEHERDRVDKRIKWKKGQKYRWRIESQGPNLSFYVDDKKIITYKDKYPLRGPGHDRLGFTNWKSEVRYDNLKITPL